MLIMIKLLLTLLIKYEKIQNLRLIALPKFIENLILMKDTLGEFF
jgi:hypothetical protein